MQLPAAEMATPISIHAPRVGSDSSSFAVSAWIFNFNPRSPCGERLSARTVSRRIDDDFNPRSPCGERRCPEMTTCGLWKFQSTLPVWGATCIGWRAAADLIISIHAPRVGSDAAMAATWAAASISIHAPRVGSDGIWMEATGALNISIHAPRVGSDMASACSGVM